MTTESIALMNVDIDTDVWSNVAQLVVITF